jgi:hypothetical protein
MKLRSQLSERSCSRKLWLTAAALILVAGVVDLSTLAKNAQYYSGANPLHNLSVATKMNVGKAPVVFSNWVPQPTAPAVAVPIRVERGQVLEPAILPLSRIAIALSMQHRSPPFVIRAATPRFPSIS